MFQSTQVQIFWCPTLMLKASQPASLSFCMSSHLSVHLFIRQPASQPAQYLLVTQYHSIPFCSRRQHSVPNFEKGGIRNKMSAWGDLKSSCHRYLPEGDYCVSCKILLCKIKYGFEGSISNVDLGLFQPKN